ncbi:hypothetical protein HK100_005606 [Physocladia obscura]|uniref:PDZ GRASP-type domain-containing protein n=1 Tax=Physocladia obscura TaxID=109957 RepID=A0AAD5XBT9_9FUNG|nr:hypothetical protein HK100_005606 [Physocladia obscura]
MGNAESTGAADAAADKTQEKRADAGVGFHVLGVARGSVAWRSGLQPVFDWIVAVDGVRVSDADADAGRVLAALAATLRLAPPPTLTVFSVRTKQVRPVTIDFPANSIANVNANANYALGLTLRLCRIPNSFPVWHILNIHKNSPAESAAFIPHSDYIIGLISAPVKDGAFVLTDRDSLFELVQSRVGAVVPLAVYNVVLDSLRRVDLVPRYGWGGKGCIGADIGFGPLHTIPLLTQTVNSSVSENSAPTKPVMRIISRSINNNSDLSAHDHGGHSLHDNSHSHDSAHSHDDSYSENIHSNNSSHIHGKNHSHSISHPTSSSNDHNDYDHHSHSHNDHNNQSSNENHEIISPDDDNQREQQLHPSDGHENSHLHYLDGTNLGDAGGYSEMQHGGHDEGGHSAHSHGAGVDSHNHFHS